MTKDEFHEVNDKYNFINYYAKKHEEMTKEEYENHVVELLKTLCENNIIEKDLTCYESIEVK